MLDSQEPAVPERLDRPCVEALDAILGAPYRALDHGFIRVVDYMGDEAAIVQAARVSYGKGTKTPTDDRGLIRYLMRHRHSTPFEMCEIKLHVKLPIFVARQWIRHRTANVNEYSARYSILAREFYIPEPQHLAQQSTENNQGRDLGYDDLTADDIRAILFAEASASFDAYDKLILPAGEKNGPNLARELARITLPLSTYTEWYWKIDLHNLLHFLSLRADPHAQYEIRAYAEIICDLVQMWCPDVWEAFVDYVLEAATFSRQELAAIRQAVAFARQAGVMATKPEGLSSREQREFERKLVLA